MLGILLVLLAFFNNSYAFSKPLAIIDVYGTHKLTSEEVVSNYKNQIIKIASAPHQHLDALIDMAARIKAKGDFASVNISPILYQHDPVTHITVDIVEKKDSYRLSYFLSAPKKTLKDPHNLVKKWLEYQQTGFTIFYQEKRFPAFKDCPAYHCLFGFDHPLLKKYKFIFNETERYKQDLIRIIRLDKDEQKRAAAVFLLSHIRDRNELIQLLLPSINDASSLVRNNALRVIGGMLSQPHAIQVPVANIVQALDFPSTSDRNKALYVLSFLADKTENVQYIKTHAGSYLLAALKLNQPNNHAFSYTVLKKISGQNYDEHDYKAWERWLRTDDA